MYKPTVFFSHSSLDRDYISLLREKLLRKTSKTVDIFQSSDGESIPFGNNWVHKIEENLEKAKIMFVFISPRSLRANWLYFESGFAYAKKIKVIPVGIKDVDVGEINPPLNLLQGFNIHSKDGMNNIFGVMNREFGSAFEDAFSLNDYEDLVALDKDDTTTAFKHLDEVDYIRFGFPDKIGKEDSACAIERQPLKVIQSSLQSLGVKSSYSTSDKLHSHGMTFQFLSSRFSRVEMKMDPYRFISCSSIISTLCVSLYPGIEIKKLWFKVIFHQSIRLETTDYKVSFRLQKHGIDMLEDNGKYYRYKNLIFNLQPASSEHESREVDTQNLHINFEVNNFDPCEVLELVEVLVEAQLIDKAEQGGGFF